MGDIQKHIGQTILLTGDSFLGTASLLVIILFLQKARNKVLLNDLNAEEKYPVTSLLVNLSNSVAQRTTVWKSYTNGTHIWRKCAKAYV